MKLGSTGAESFRKPERFLLLLVLCVFWNLTIHAAPLKFVQVTDLHLYDKNEGPANTTALIDFIQKLKELTDNGEVYDFVVVTGDIGIEGLIKELYKGDPELSVKEEELKIENSIIAAATKVAAILDRSSIRKWLFLPGNNDLIDEEIETGKFYSIFIGELRIQLINKKEIRDLTDTKYGPYIKDSHVFVGFNNASFKNNDDPRRIIDEKAEEINIEAIKRRISLTEVSRPPLSPVGQKQKIFIAQVAEFVDRYPSSNVYILYHIPEIDDSHPVLDFSSEAASKRLLSLNEPYAISAWFVEDEVRRSWHDVVNKNQVKALLAGHFHDWRYETYEKGYRWMRTPASLYGSVQKLLICPPLAIKRQADAVHQARGFQVVSVDDAGNTIPIRWWYYSATHTFKTTAPAASDGTEENAMKIFEQIVLLFGHLAWPMVAIVALIFLKGPLRQVFRSLGTRVADPSTNVSFADWLTLTNNVAANSGKLESLELGLQVVGATVPAAAPVATERSQPDETKLRELADEYLNVNISDYSARVRRKNQLATEMGNFIIQHQISRQRLAVQNHEGLTVGLASAINALPLEGDLDLLLKASKHVKKLHVMYRIVVAIGRLFEAGGGASAADGAGAKEVLNAFMQRADDSLKRRITQTQSIIDLAINKPKADV
jgi:UDP-2,3-diacylglucosamine pyrophosphatase LpxH